MAAGSIGNGRVLKVCDLCGGVDDHPRHSIAGTRGADLPDELQIEVSDEIVNRVLDNAPVADRPRLLRELQDRASSDRHLDCCANAGCPTGTCGPQVANAPGTGRKMLDHVMKIKDPFAERDDVVKGE